MRIVKQQRDAQKTNIKRKEVNDIKTNNLKILKMQKTKLIKKSGKLVEEFIQLQDKLKKIELQIKEIESEEK